MATRLSVAIITAFCGAAILRGADAPKPFGSGIFGRWTTDEWGLPAYDYTIDERIAPEARQAELHGGTDAWWQLGNDHIVANAYNHGYVQLWSQDREAQWVNRYEPGARQYSGGFGYLKVDGHVLCTLADDRPPGQRFDRRFGVGYFRHTTGGFGVTVDEQVYAPFGDAAVLYHDVCITNLTARPMTLDWWEYWGVNPFAFAWRSDADTVPSLVRRGIGQVHYDPRTRVLSVRQDPFKDDRSPLTIFAAAIDAPVAGYETTTDRFFGAGPRRRPAALDRSAPSDALARGDAGPGKVLFAFRSPFALGPGKTVRLRYAYGFAHDEQIPALVHPAGGAETLDASERAWKGWLPRADFGPEYSWLSRELGWAAYFVRSSSVYEEIPGRHVITQGGYYQYVMGAQIAFRDPLQHMLPIIYSDPELAREVLVYSAQQQSSFDGSIPYGRTGMGHAMDIGASDDMDVWLLLSAIEYVTATRDIGFLQSPVRWSDGGTASFWSHLVASFKHQETFAVGSHDLYVTGKNGDWSDFIPQRTGLTESTLVPAQLAYVYPRLAALARWERDAGLASRIEARAAAIKKTLRREWVPNGWYSRGYAANRQLGRGVIFGEPQSWAILSGAPTPQQARTLVGNIRRFLTGVGAPAFLHGPSRIGSSICPAADDPLVTEREFDGQMGDNNAVYVGGTWYAINGVLTWALGSLDGELAGARNYAWDELLRNTLAFHALAFPRHWDGITSVDDVCWSWYSSHPERCGLDFFGPYEGQVTHQPAWLWFDLIRLAGVEPQAWGYKIDPHIPRPRYSIDMPGFGIEVAGGRIAGYCKPLSAGPFEIRCRIPNPDLARPVATTVDGRTVAHRLEDGFAAFTVPGGTPGARRNWAVSFYPTQESAGSGAQP